MSNQEKIDILAEKREKLNSVSCSFCTAKWLQTTLYLQNGFNHSCHHPAPHKVPVEEVLANPAALHNSKFKKQQRAMMLNGERPKECDYCWNIEDLGKGHFSDRHIKSAEYWSWPRLDEIATSKFDDDVYPSYLEVSFSNVCNLACAYCSPEISSKWMEDIKQNGPYPTSNGAHHLEYMKQVGKFPYKNSDDNPYVDAFWKWIPDALPHLRVFRLTGGEPLMSKDTWRMLDYLIEHAHKDLSIQINTNLCVPDNLIDKFIEKVNLIKEKRDKQVKVYTSIESTGEQAEYARDGLNYEQWLRNTKRILSETESAVGIMTTINILSLSTFSDFLEMVIDVRKQFNTCLEENRLPISINYLRWPPHLQCNLLGFDIRERYADDIERTCEKYLDTNDARIYLEEYDQIKRFCNYIRRAPTALEFRKDFVKFIDAYDDRRRKTFFTAFPEFSEFVLGDWDEDEE